MVSMSSPGETRHEIMTPNGSTKWLVEERPEAGGRLYMAQSCPRSVAEAVVHYAATPPDDSEAYMNDTQKSLYRTGSFLVKRFQQLDENVSGMPALKANVALSEGLRCIPQRNLPFAKQKYHFSAPRYYAAFQPGMVEPEGPRPVWIMDFIDGRTPGPYEMPPDKVAFSRYHRALKACGMSYLDVNYDNAHRNTLIKASEDPSITEVVKLDLQATDRSRL